MLSYGFESRSLKNLTAKTRWNISRSISTNFLFKQANNVLTTPAFTNQNYFINEYLAQPSISYLEGTKLRTTLTYGYDVKSNTIGYLEHTMNQQFSADIKYSVLSSSTLTARISMQNISFTSATLGSSNSTVGYVMLDGLLPGQNYLWNFELIKRITGNLELNLQYDGRKSAGTKTVNTGRASIRAIF